MAAVVAVNKFDHTAISEVTQDLLWISTGF